jgi:frataxin-like iron-binding protein CyaY
MTKTKLDDFIKGWIIGNFSPTLHATNQFEVAVKKYQSGEYEKRHFHKIAKEWIQMYGQNKFYDTLQSKITRKNKKTNASL